MLVEDLKAEECKDSQELHSKASIFLDKNEYSKDDLEHCIDWLLKSMVSMEKTFNRVKYERDTIHASTSNIKEAYELNLKNNQTLSNEAKGFAYKIWRYNKKAKAVAEIMEKAKKLPLWLIPGGRVLKKMIFKMETDFKNFDNLTNINLDEVDEKVAKYMERPVLFDPQKISKEEFEKLMAKPAQEKQA